jgi:hypothetical protein
MERAKMGLKPSQASHESGIEREYFIHVRTKLDEVHEPGIHYQCDPGIRIREP